MNDDIARIDDADVADVVPAYDHEIGGDSVEKILTQLRNNSNNAHDHDDDGDDDSSSIDIDVGEVLFEVQKYLGQRNDDENNTPEQAVAKAEKQKNRAEVMRIAEAITGDPNLSEEEKGPALREAANHPLTRGYFERGGFVQVTAQEYEEYEAKIEALKQSLVKDWEEIRRLTNAN
mmetsp:Transcript_38676/g.43541  ORF Transcript_38676/g.43541 Transcript_38676/m.43541 type:complete len:176 (-) Transcript_38676:75-602(-)